MNFKRLFFVLLISFVMTLLTLASGQLAIANMSTNWHNSRPVANAGPDQTAQISETVILDGSGSSDPDGDRLRYCWTLISRPHRSRARIQNIHSSQARLCPDRAGDYIVMLIVNDGRLFSRPDFVRITVGASNSAPVAEDDSAITSQNTPVIINVLANDMDDDDDTLTITSVSQPANGCAEIHNNQIRYTPNQGFIGQDSFTYTVSDGHLCDTATVNVTVTNDNQPPSANAGPDQTAPVVAAVQLDGSGSSDQDGDALTFQWSFVSKPSGSSATLSDPTTINPAFTIDAPGDYVIQLTVNDGSLNSPPDTVVVSTVNSPPVANAGPDQTTFVTDTATLDGSGSTDIDGDLLTFAWSFVSRPAGSNAALSDPTAVNPAFIIDAPGDYVIQLTVNDGIIDSAPDTMTISTENSAPVANAGPDQTAFVDDNVQLDGSGSSDIDGDSLTFSWSFVSRPSGSAATLSDPAAINPTFVVDVPGDYLLQLIVNDGSISSAPDTVMITTENRPPVANAGPDQTVALGATVQLDGSGSSDPDGDPVSFTWSLLSAPQGSLAALSDPNASSPTFIADLLGNYVVQLIVSDGRLNSAPDTVVISTENSAPIANAGPDQSVTAGATVQLDGSGSTDPDGTPLQFTWSLTTRPPGSAAAISDATVVNPTFVADLAGVYVAQLIVSDGTVASAPDTVMITAVGVPIVNIAATDGNAEESGSDPATFTFSRTGDTTLPLTITYTVGGTATNGGDYSTIPETVTIPAGASSAVITITPTDDTLPEGDETVTITLVDDAAYDTGLPDNATITIADDDQPVITIVATDPDAAEAGPDTGTFTFTRTGDVTAPLDIAFTIGGTANALDYNPIPANITIPAGSATATLTVTPIADASVEADETVIVTLSPGSVYVVGSPATASVTIADSPIPVVTITITDSAAAEFEQNTATFTLSRTGPTNNPLTVNYTITGTAINGTDYVTIPTIATIPAGTSSTTITVTPIDDSVFELPESVTLTLSASPQYTIDPPGLASVAIADNDTLVTVVATDSVATENSLDTGTFTVSRLGPTDNEMTVFYTLSGTAINGADYITLSGNVIIPTGSTSATVTVTSIDDALFEGPENVILTLSPDAAYTVGVPAAATVTITDDERPTVTLTATDDLAGEAGPDTGTFTVTRTGPTSAPLTVNIGISGSATNGFDYQTVPANIIVPAGSPSAVITITPIDDSIVEGAEIVIISVAASPDYAVGIPGIGIINIADDDLSQVSVVATDPVATEAGLTTGTFTFSRTGDTSAALTVGFTRSGTATAGGGTPDYTSANINVTIPAGQSSVNVTVTPIADNLVEGDETVILTINPSLNYVVGTPSSATVTMVDDPAIVTLTATDANASEAGLDPGVFTFTRTGGNIAAALTVGFTRAGTAANNGDYAIIGGNISIPANQSSVTLTITPLPDNIVESDETVILTLNLTVFYLTGSPNTATVTIADDPAVVTVLASDADASEAGLDPGVFTFTRSGGNLNAQLLLIVSRSGTASNGADYVSIGGSNFFVTIPANQTSTTVTVTPLADNLVESPETLILTIQPNSAYLIGTQGTATVTIADDPPVLSVTATDPEASESGVDPGVFTFTRTGGNLAAALTINFSRSGTASNSSDYTNIGFSVTIPANQTSVTLTIAPVDDALVEGSETVIVTISASANYIVGAAGTATVTISDND